MSQLSGKRILLVIGGGIAGYKIFDLIRRLRERNAEPRVVLTQAAKNFVSPLTAASLSGAKIYDDLFSLTDETDMGHIQLSRSADAILVAPATADLMAKAAQGLANDLASALLLASDKAPVFAPAMNVRMWLHPATQRNVRLLLNDGAQIWGPDAGDMACGEYGLGRMIEVDDILRRLEGFFSKMRVFLQKTRPLAGRRAIVTAGPTREPIDPVRFLTNRSSGKQGYAIAQALAEAGAEVVLASGPTNLPAPPGVVRKDVETAEDMLQAVKASLPADIFIGAAAVSDWRVEPPAAAKIKKSSSAPPTLNLAENPDILAFVAQLPVGRPTLVAGFAAETENLLENAQKKLMRKKCDFIAANDVSPENGVFDGDGNRVAVVEARGIQVWPLLSKRETAERLAALVVERLREKEK